MRVIPCFAAVVLALSASVAGADDRDRQMTLNARLSGFAEVPVISTTGKGSFRATIDPVSGNIDYTLSYADLQGKVTQAHIHIGPAQAAGGIAVWLCQTATNAAPVTIPPSVVPTCPDPSGTIKGTITPAHVIGPNAQLIAPGQLDEVVAAIKAGVAYVNVHSSAVPAGEIRGQFRPRHH
jgi:hypothetical protein